MQVVDHALVAGHPDCWSVEELPRAAGQLFVSMPAGRRCRRFCLTLRPGTSFSDDGCTRMLHGPLSLVLRHWRITQQVVTEPVG
jgi:hypothetical protein